MTKPYRAQANLIKAMAHPTRLHILEILSQGEACVCHLTAILDQRQPNVSQHLMVLREAGLVKDRRDGTTIYYRLADPLLSDVIKLTREIMVSNGEDLEFPEIPTGPVEGCPCPKCVEGAPCC